MFLAAADPLLSFGGVDSKSGILTDVMGAFTRFISNGGDKVVEAEAKLAGALLAMQFLKVLSEVGLSRGTVARALGTFMVALIWYHVATNAVQVTAAYMTWMGSIGSFLSGGTLAGDIMADPSRFMNLGSNAFKALMTQALEFNLIIAAAAVLVYFALGAFVLLCFIVMGAIVVYTVVRSSLDVILGLTFLPFVIEPRTAFLASTGFGLIIRAGLSLGATSLAIGVSYGFLKEIHLQPAPTIQDGVNLAAAALLCAIISGGSVFVGKGFMSLVR